MYILCSIPLCPLLSICIVRTFFTQLSTSNLCTCLKYLQLPHSHFMPTLNCMIPNMTSRIFTMCFPTEGSNKHSFGNLHPIYLLKFHHFENTVFYYISFNTNPIHVELSRHHHENRIDIFSRGGMEKWHQNIPLHHMASGKDSPLTYHTVQYMHNVSGVKLYESIIDESLK